MPAHSTTRWLRSLFRFRLRTLLVVMLLVSVACGYLGKHLYRKSIERPIVARIEAAGGVVRYDYQWKPNITGYDRTSFAYDATNSPPGHHLIRGLFGDDVFASVESIQLLGLDSTAQDDLSAACQLPALKGISLVGGQFDDNCAATLANAEGIESLELDDTALTPEGIDSLTTLPRLRFVVLQHSSASDEHIRAAAKLPHLRDLQIISSSITKTGVDGLGEASGLTSLQLLGCRKLDDEMLLGLKSLTLLKRLQLHNTGCTGQALNTICHLPDLEVLAIGRLPLTPEQTRQLSQLSQLERLVASGTKLDDEGAAAIGELKKLRSLNIAATKVSDIGAAHIAGLSNLEELSIETTNISDAGLQQLASLPKLKFLELDIGMGSEMTLEGAQKFLKACSDCEIECIHCFPDGTTARIDLATGEIKTF